MQISFSDQSKREVKQVLLITLAWLIIGIIAILYDYSLSFTPYVTFHDITLRQMLVAQVLTSIVSSMVTGLLIVKYFLKWIRTRPYGQALLMIWLTYTLLSFLTALISLNFFYPDQLNLPFLSFAVQVEAFRFIFGPEFLRYYFLWLVVLLATMITFLVNDKYGPGVFKDFLLGRYFKPQHTERIFMFLDLRGSTSIAEKLGDVQYFTFLKEVFTDVTPAIIDARGEIYQYVGDEIIVSWKMDSGLKNARCVKCFLEVQEILAGKSNHYQQHFGVVPVFKAGLHHGSVIAGEIGVVKREITFSGDVLNTTARIQGKCNEMGVDLLLSNDLFGKLTSTGAGLAFRKIGEVTLAGKQEKMLLFTV